jgi:hypothetical protein
VQKDKGPQKLKQTQVHALFLRGHHLMERAGGRTDERTDGRTDGRTDISGYWLAFFVEKKKPKKNIIKNK